MQLIRKNEQANNNLASLNDVFLWQTMNIQEQDSTITSFSKLLGRSYKHLYTRNYEAYKPNPSLRIPTFRHSSTGIDFNLIIGGSYTMGFSPAEEEAMLAINSDALFTREVLPSPRSIRVQPFLMSRLPVLDKLVRRFVSINPNLFRPEFSRNSRDKMPIFLTREEIGILLQKTGFDMPSEAQLEYAFRGLSSTLFPFGNQLPTNETLKRLFLDIFNDEKKCLDAANPFGLIGIYIGEWCQDSFHKDQKGVDHNNDSDYPICYGSPYVIRGGASSVWPWQGGSEWLLCMSAARWDSETLEDGTCGVRLVKRIKI